MKVCRTLHCNIGDIVEFIEDDNTENNDQGCEYMSVLEYVRNQTKEFLENMPKSVRKKKKHFFTSVETAIFMSEMFDFSNCGDEASVLDSGAGTGILTAAFVDRLFKENPDIRIAITCYETDAEVLLVLKNNLEHIKNMFKDSLNYRIIEEDYILSQSNDFQENLLAAKDPEKYDYVIGNPPYLRVMRDNSSAIATPKVVHSAPNLYFLFASMRLFNIKNNAEMVYIILSLVARHQVHILKRFVRIF